jgi:hypothetical protein
MSHHSDTLSWFIASQFLLFLLNAASLAEKQQKTIFFGWTRSRLETTISRTRCEHANHSTTDAVHKRLHYFVFHSFDYERTWWWLCQERVVCNKLNIYVFITITLVCVDASAGGQYSIWGYRTPLVNVSTKAWFIKLLLKLMFSSLRHGRLWPVFVTLFRFFDFFASKYF